MNSKGEKRSNIYLPIFFEVYYKLLCFIHKFMPSNDTRHFRGITISKTTQILRFLYLHESKYIGHLSSA